MKNVEVVPICSWNASAEVSWNRCQTICPSAFVCARSGIRQSRRSNTSAFLSVNHTRPSHAYDNNAYLNNAIRSARHT